MPVDLPSLGWDGYFQAQYEPHRRPDHRPGRVTRSDRGICSVLGECGATRASIGGAWLAAAAQDPVKLPCAGDWVVVRRWPDDRTTIEAVLRRRTAVLRASAGLEATTQVLAANVDSLAVVAALDPEPDIGMIERLVALAWASGARPQVLLTKSDLVRAPEQIAAVIARSTPGVEVYAVSAAIGTGLQRVRAAAPPGTTLGMLGPSGAGKSTLINALVGATVMGTQSIRRADGRGRHTTTFRALVPLPGGGTLLDTPGLRAVGLTGYSLAGEYGLERTFADLEALAATCRFRDCSHVGEPGCAIMAAVDSGQVTQRRLASWRKLQREIAYATKRHEARQVIVKRHRGRRPRVRGRELGGA